MTIIRLFLLIWTSFAFLSGWGSTLQLYHNGTRIEIQRRVTLWMLGNFLKIDYIVVCLLKPLKSASCLLGMMDKVANRLDLRPASRRVTRRQAWIQPVCISINAVPAQKGLIIVCFLFLWVFFVFCYFKQFTLMLYGCCLNSCLRCMLCFLYILFPLIYVLLNMGFGRDIVNFRI